MVLVPWLAQEGHTTESTDPPIVSDSSSILRWFRVLALALLAGEALRWS